MEPNVTLPINIVIFALDDSPIELEILKRKLDAEYVTNYKLFTNVEEFFSQFTKDVNLTIIDYLLGEGQTGIQIIKRIKDTNPLCYNIIMSGFANPDTIIEFGKNGADNFVNKNHPDYLDELIEIIRTETPKIQQATTFINKWLPKGND